MTRVAAYCRVSTDQEDQLGSLAHQRQYFEEYIGRQWDWRLVEVFADEGISGTSAVNRPAFQRMMEAAYAGEIDLILTKEVSRFARNTVDTLAHTRELRRRGVGVLFINDHIDTRQNDGEFRLTIMASVAQEESRKTSERVKWGQKRSMENGVVFGSNSLYGYDLQNGKLTVKPEEAAVIRRVYHKFLDEGKGTHVIARELYEEGIRPPKSKGKPWSSVMILRLLRNEKYCGDLLQRKYHTPNYLDHKKVPNPHEEDKVYLRDHHEAIIPRETFERVQQELTRRSPSGDQRARHSARYWCSGKIVCGCCGARFVPRKRIRAGGMPYFCWTCHAKGHFGNRKIDGQGNAVGCDMRSINNRTIHVCMAYVADLLRIDASRFADEVIELLAQPLPSGDSGEHARLRTQQQRLIQKKDAVLDAYFEQTISKADMERMNRRYEEELSRICGRIHDLEQQEKWNEPDRGNLEELRTYIRQSALRSEEVWGELLERITVYGDCVTIQLRALPVLFRLRYTTSGKGESYQTAITGCTMEPPFLE